MPSLNNASRSLFLVDDEPLILESFGQLLRTHLSCDVHTFVSPIEALQQVIALNPGVIISDYSMPGMNGFKFLAEAQRFVPDANFIIITGGPLDFDVEELQLLPALKGILRKPLHWRNLAEFVVDNWPDEARPALLEHALAS
jgi:DNA-binding NarL/FixJ family response regulator